MKGYSPRWKSADLNVVTDETALSAIEGQVFADAATNGRTAGLKPLEIREAIREPWRPSAIEFVGGEEAHFTRQFSREPRLGVFRPREEYEAMSRDAQLSRIGAIVHDIDRRWRRRGPRSDSVRRRGHLLSRRPESGPDSDVSGSTLPWPVDEYRRHGDSGGKPSPAGIYAGES